MSSTAPVGPPPDAPHVAVPVVVTVSFADLHRPPQLTSAHVPLGAVPLLVAQLVSEKSSRLAAQLAPFGFASQVQAAQVR